MWRLGLAVFGGWLGYSLAKSGKSRKNMFLFTLSALAMYKLTQLSMESKAKVRLANKQAELEPPSPPVRSV